MTVKDNQFALEKNNQFALEKNNQFALELFVAKFALELFVANHNAENEDQLKIIKPVLNSPKQLPF